MILSKSRQYRLRRMGGQSFLLGSNNAFSINETMASIWSLIDGLSNVDEIASKLSKEYDASHTDIKDAIIPTIEYLVQEGAVTTSG